MSDSPVLAIDGGVRLAVRVMPRATRTALEGVRDGRLVLRVTAPPVDGAANDAVIAAIAALLGVPKRAVVIAAGDTSRNKAVTVKGVDVARARAALLSRP